MDEKKEKLKIVDNDLYCPTCDEKMHAKRFKDLIPNCSEEIGNQIVEMQTLVGYGRLPGHDHDDNCWKRTYICSNEHVIEVGKIRKCPNCEWVGKSSCFCHYGMKVEEWPNE